MARQRPRVVLTTERLVLGPLSPGDLEPVRGIFDDPAVRRHLFDDEPVSVGTARSLLERSEADFASGGVGLFGLSERGSGGLIGFCGFFVAENIGEPELAYGLLPAYWGRGLATEAARAVARYALGAGFPRVLVAADGENPASTRVIERLGARRLGKMPGAPAGVVYFELGPGSAMRPDEDADGVPREEQGRT